MNVELVRKTFTDWTPIHKATHACTLPKRRAARLALDLQPSERARIPLISIVEATCDAARAKDITRAAPNCRSS